MVDSVKENFTQPLSASEILDELEISKINYYKLKINIQKPWNKQP